MRTALAGQSGYKTHFVSDTSADKVEKSGGRIMGKTLCGQYVTVMRKKEYDDLSIMSGSDGFCKRCQARKVDNN